jgi:hypothetical protein
MGRGEGELVPPHRGKVLGSRPPIVVTVGTVPRCGPAVDCVGRETPTGATFEVEGGEAGLDIPYAFTLRGVQSRFRVAGQHLNYDSGRLVIGCTFGRCGGANHLQANRSLAFRFKAVT